MLAIAALSWHEPRVLWPTLAAIVCLLCAQAVFWIYTYPANVATDNWTTIPAEWESLRTRWEYSHAIGAAFQLLAMSALIIAALARAHPHVTARHDALAKKEPDWRRSANRADT
jgi:hypothetical protein